MKLGKNLEIHNRIFRDILYPVKAIKLDTVEKVISLLHYAYIEKLNNNEMSFAAILDENYILLELIFDSEGNENVSDIHYKELALRANKIGGKNIIIAHTHPNYSLVQSEKDSSSVKLFRTYFAEWGIKLLDSCVFSKDNLFYSSKANKTVYLKDRDLTSFKLKSIYAGNFLTKVINDRTLILEINLNRKLQKKNYITL